MSTLVPGAHLHGRYRVVRPIGHGGMGAVYEAIDTRLKNTVAIKQMTAMGPDVDHAFRQEAEILAGLRHRALPVVIDYFADTGEQFLVMQYIEGEDLADVLERLDHPCDVDDVIAWGRTVLEALSYLHDHRPPIVHRDIKPSNLKLTPGGEILLLDFGLAKGRDALTETTRRNRSLYGFTLKYAPIEQIEGRGTDARGDLYALAATLYHLVTGSPPASAVARAAAIRSGQNDPLVDARVLNPAVSESFSETLRRALAVEPAGRFSTASDMLIALKVLPARTRDHAQADAAPPAARRVDAAMPSQTVVGQLTDLIVQVRFTNSPLLGLEDWPTARRPAEIEQGAEQLNIAYPVDRATGRLMPARVRIRVVAPHFTVDGEAAYLIEVPPREYSKRLVFLMTPQRAGPCRVHVEVYGPDAVLLGSIPVESEVASSGIVQPLRRVAHLVLNVFARPSAPSPIETPRAAAPRATRDDPSLMSSVTPPGAPTAARRSGRRWILGAAPVLALAAGGWLTFTLLRPTAPDGQLAGGPEIVTPTPSATPPPVMPAEPPPPTAVVPAPSTSTVAPAPPAASLPPPAAGPVTASPAPAPAAPATPAVSPPPPMAAGPTIPPAAPATATPARSPSGIVSSLAPQPTAIQPFLTELTEAYRTRSASAVRSLWRDAPASETDFTGVQTYEVILDACEIVQEQTTATATCTRVTTITPTAGEPRSDSRRVRYVLAWRTNVLTEGPFRRTGWFIERVE